MSQTLIYPEWVAPQKTSTQAVGFTAKYGQKYLCTATLSVQLPAPAVVNKGRPITIKSSGAFVITLVRDAAEEIEGQAADFTFSSVRQSVTLITDGVNWFII